MKTKYSLKIIKAFIPRALYMLTQWIIKEKWLDLNYLPFYILAFQVIAIRFEIVWFI